MASQIDLGQIDCGIAGGVDTTSDASIGVNEGPWQILPEADGASLMPLASEEEWGRARGLQVLAYLRVGEAAA